MPLNIIHPWFNPSRMLQRIDDDIANHVKDAIEVHGRDGKYQEKASLYEKYLRRDCSLQPELKELCYAQFIKRYSSLRKIPKTHKFKSNKISKKIDSNGNILVDDIIITKNIDNEQEVFKLPQYIKLKDSQEKEPGFMRKRTKAVLRIHKFKKTKTLHEYLFSELQLYHPHTNYVWSKLLPI